MTQTPRGSQILISWIALQSALLGVACGGPSNSGIQSPATNLPSGVLSFDDFVAFEKTHGNVWFKPADAIERESAASDSVGGTGGVTGITGITGVTGPTGDVAADCHGNCARMRQELRYVVYVGRQIYAYWDIKQAETHTDFGALAETLEKSIVNGTSMTQYYRVLSRWAAAFHDGHVNAFYKNDDSDFEVYSSPVRLEVLAPATPREKVIVAQDADAAGLAAGDEVLKINGRAAKLALDDAERLTSGSTSRMRRLNASRALVDAYGKSDGATNLVLTIRRADNVADIPIFRTVEISASPRGASGDAAADADETETGLSYVHSIMLPGGIAYLRINSFSGTQDAEILGTAMTMLSSADGLLIDVRRNGGGDQSGDVILSRLAGAALTRYRTSPRMSDFTLANRPAYFDLDWKTGEAFAGWRDERVAAPRGAPPFTGKPVVLLTGTDCFSACDTFTSAIQVNHLATVVGEPTGGGTGQPLVFALPGSQMRFRYSVLRGVTAEGKPIEGVGTRPDVLIERTQAERIAGQDAQLLKATEILRKQIQERKQPLPASTPPHPATAAAAAAATRTMLSKLSPSWAQDSLLSPTRAEQRRLRAIMNSDELAAPSK